MDRVLTKSEKIDLSLKEIAKRVRTQLKQEFPLCKFSVRTEYYSMGCALHVSVMKADRKIVQDFNKIPESTIWNYTNRSSYRSYTVEELKKLQGDTYHQLSSNGFYHYQKYDPNHWCNGVFLTYQGYLFLKRVYQIIDQYNYDDSDSMTDYYSVHFSLHYQLGKYDNPFIDGTTWIDDKDLVKRVENRDKLLKEYYEMEKKKKEEQDHLNRLNRESHTEKSRRAVQQVKDIMRSTAFIGANGLEVLTPKVKARKIAEIEDVKQLMKVEGINWKRFILELD